MTDDGHVRHLRACVADEEIRRRHPTAHARALYWRRRRLKLSLEDAAAKLSLTTDELERIESGALTPDDTLITHIAALYCLDLEALREDFAADLTTGQDRH